MSARSPGRRVGDKCPKTCHHLPFTANWRARLCRKIIYHNQLWRESSGSSVDRSGVSAGFVCHGLPRSAISLAGVNPTGAVGGGAESAGGEGRGMGGGGAAGGGSRGGQA